MNNIKKRTPKYTISLQFVQPSSQKELKKSYHHSAKIKNIISMGIEVYAKTPT